MKIPMCVIIAVYASFSAWAQNKTYVSAKVGRVTQFTSKTDTISFSDYVQVDTEREERFAFMDDAKYKIVKSERNGDEVEEIFDESGLKVATVPLTGARMNSLVFNDGTELNFVSTGKTTWSYQRNGADALKGYYYLLNDQKHYVIQWDDTTVTNSLVPLLILSYGTGSKHVYRNKKKTAAILTVVGLSTFLAVIRLAMDDQDDF